MTESSSIAPTANRGAPCGICGGAAGTMYAVREMMFGTRDLFHYFACDACGCAQLVDLPADLARYYPPDYYSYSPPPERIGIRGIFRRVRNRGTFASHLDGGTPAGRLARSLSRRFAYPIPGAENWMPRLGARRESRILDVGSGSGALLLDLANAGYTRLTGADPYVDKDIEYPNGVRILKRSLAQLDEKFDVIMMHHAFEHVPNPAETMGALADHLASNGVCLIRTPTTSSWAWEHYREHWVQLDAPRHLYIHSRRSLAILAERAGLEIFHTADDSTEFQFTGSELYRGNRPLTELSSAYSRAAVHEHQQRAAQLNREHRGDQAAFYLRHRAKGA